jgi:DNA-binding Xre family transcriptional regulator
MARGSKEELAAWVAKLREMAKHEVSKTELARKLGIQPPTLSRILSGKRSGLRTWRYFRDA